MLDSGIAAMLRKLQDGGEQPLFSNTTATESRARGEIVRSKYYPPVPVDVARVEDRQIPGPSGDITIRVYWPTYPTDATVVYLHGGGWIIGDLDSHDGHARRVAETSRAVVVLVKYRLAPENPFPAGLDDGVAATQWVFDHVDRLGGNRDKVTVAGDSAGANLAAVIAVHCRDRELPLAAQLLLYPITDVAGAISGKYAASPNDVDGGFFTGEQDHWMERQYLGDDLARAADPRVSPLLTENLQGLAPAIIAVGGHDDLYGQCIAYAQALQSSGVTVIFREYPGMIHGFFGMGQISEGAETAADELCRDLASLLHDNGDPAKPERHDSSVRSSR